VTTDPGFFFDQSGLRVQTLAAAIRQRVDLGRLVMHRDTDANDALWYCQDGLWRPGAVKEVERACNELLDERLRGHHVSNALLALRAGDLPQIEDGPPHPHLINFDNGLLDFMAPAWSPHGDGTACAWRSTVRLAVRWDPDATCPEYDRWVQQMLPADCGDFIDEVTGYLMRNGNPLHKAILLHGSGRNGKGTWLRIHTALLGTRNCASVPLQSLGENRFAGAELHMKLANVTGDLDSRRVEQTDMFKKSIGEDLVYAERKNGQPFRFTPWAVPVFSANLIPLSSDTSEGYLSKWEVVPFPVDLRKLPGGIDPSIEKRILEDELPGVARRGVEGLRRLEARGRFQRPASVQEAYGDFERRLDQVRAWKSERCDTADDGAWTYRTDAYGDYALWAGSSNHAVMSAALFYERLEASGNRPRKHDNARGFAGVRLLHPPSVDAARGVTSENAPYDL
jgi:putative DNA primase/helicase